MRDQRIDSIFEQWKPRIFSLLRMITGLLFFEHGSSKILHFPYVAMFADIKAFSLIGISGFLELVGGGLLALGLFTRPVAFIISGEMAIAYFMAHAPKSFYPVINQGETAILYCFVFIYFAVAGGGPFSLDALFKRTVLDATIVKDQEISIPLPHVKIFQR